MTQLSEQEFVKLTKLCRINCSSKERETLVENISKILSYVDLLQELNTSDVPPCIHAMAEKNHVPLREDSVGTLLPREEFLANAPSQIGGMIRVPPVLSSSTS
jgi:aspartyl-tRNA(Asn)/glutamyl-tRNA(Gln) amidotransferase subunit C